MTAGTLLNYKSGNDHAVISFLNSFLIRRIADDYLAVPCGKEEQIILLNETGALLWKLYASGKTTEEVRTILAETYDADPSEITAGCEDFLRKIREARS